MDPGPLLAATAFHACPGTELGIEVESLPSGVTLANGSEQPVSRTARAVPFSVDHDYTEDLQFTVTDVTYDIILGLPWLESGNKQVD